LGQRLRSVSPYRHRELNNFAVQFHFSNGERLVLAVIGFDAGYVSRWTIATALANAPLKEIPSHALEFPVLSLKDED